MRKTRVTPELPRDAAKVILLLCLLGTVLTSSGNSQYATIPCPSVVLHVPSYLVSSRTPLSISVDIAGGRNILGEPKLKELDYKWEVSGATISGGLRTPRILIDASRTSPGHDSKVNVSLLVSPLAPECQFPRSIVLHVDSGCPPPTVFDDYGDLPFREERSHLDRLAKAMLERGPKSIGYIVDYIGRRACVSEAAWRVARAKKYLIQNFQINDAQIVTLDGGAKEQSATELYVTDAGDCGPFPDPTMSIDDSYVQGFCSDKYLNDEAGFESTE